SAVRKNPVVGYAGGSKKEEFEFLEVVIARLNKIRPDIRFEFIGGFSDGLRELNNVQWFPGFNDYAKFLAFKVSRGWTVGLAPLMDSEFNASKTNNKFREYAGCNIAGLYSKTSPYVECVRSGESGLLVKNSPDDWVEAIIRMVDDQSLCERIKAEAFSFVDSNYSHEVIAPVWKAAIDSIPGMPPLKNFGSAQFRFFKYYRLIGFTDAAQEDSKFSSMFRAVLRRKVRSLLNRVSTGHLLIVSVLIVLCLANFFTLMAKLL
ncbi:glycosyltransferase, partial [Pseudomonas fluorescens]